MKRIKKLLQTAGCMVGGGMIGCSVNRLDSIAGIISAIGGVVLMGVSIQSIIKPEKDDQ